MNRTNMFSKDHSACRLLRRATVLTTIAVLGILPAVKSEQQVPCQRFSEIYRDGKDLCERIFGDSFVYVSPSQPFEYDLAYSPWFFTGRNPNDAITMKRKIAGRHHLEYTDMNICYLRSPGITYHKERPSAENQTTFTQCWPYQKNACCLESTVESATTMEHLYGPNFQWDRCGTLSQECEAFFVQESCFYECDPNAGLFRKYPPSRGTNTTGEEWRIAKLPIKGDYCDAWFHACQQDYFCADGDIFQCATKYSVDSGQTEQQQKDAAGPNTGQNLPGPKGEPHYEIPAGAVLGIVLASLVFASMLVFTVLLVRKERQGRPMFMRISPTDPSIASAEPPRGRPADARIVPVDTYRDVYVI